MKIITHIAIYCITFSGFENTRGSIHGTKMTAIRNTEASSGGRYRLSVLFKAMQNADLGRSASQLKWIARPSPSQKDPSRHVNHWDKLSDIT